MNVKKRIETLMDQRGWTAYRLGKESGLAQSTLAHVFREDSAPTIATLESICSAFGITLSQFFAEGDFVSLTSEQMILLEKWATLNEDQKRLVIDMIENMK